MQAPAGHRPNKALQGTTLKEDEIALILLFIFGDGANQGYIESHRRSLPPDLRE